MTPPLQKKKKKGSSPQGCGPTGNGGALKTRKDRKKGKAAHGWRVEFWKANESPAPSFESDGRLRRGGGEAKKATEGEEEGETEGEGLISGPSFLRPELLQGSASAGVFST